MSTGSPSVLVFGAGGNIGHHVGETFAKKGYKVVLVSRTAQAPSDNTLEKIFIQWDLSDPTTIPKLFDVVRSLVGYPSVVVYNAVMLNLTEPDNPFSIPIEDFRTGLDINTASAYAAAQQAALGFAQLPESASRTFIYTGNTLNVVTIPRLMGMGVGKAGAAHMIQAAAEAFKDNGFKFYYADERQEDGQAKYAGVDGEAHAKLYAELAEERTQGVWQQTFLAGVGYRRFLE